MKNSFPFIFYEKNVNSNPFFPFFLPSIINFFSFQLNLLILGCLGFEIDTLF
jgi:hypothetical protein